MPKQIIATENAPAAAGPYSQAVLVNGFLFVAGQVGFIPGTKDFAEGGVSGQTEQVMKNIQAILEAAGTNMDNVIKTTIFLDDIGDFGTVNEIYGSFFAENPPVRSTVQVGKLPLGALVEIETIALVE